jgi:hypothetical protein
MPVAAAGGSYSLFGDATYVAGHNSPRAVQTTSGPTGAGYGGIDFAVPAGLTLSGVNTLSTDFEATAGGCGGGSPRFQVTVQPPTGPQKNVFFYLGTPPNYTCPLNTWQNSGNLASPTNLVDATQIGGAFYEPYATVQTTYGTYPVTDISLVTDASWLFGTQVVVFDNTAVNGQTYTYDPPTDANQCKNGGWQNYGGMFKNQGDCVSFVATKGKNPPSGS